MIKNIVGNWGADLHQDDYACAIAALGVLEARGTEQYGRISNDPNKVLRGLLTEMEGGRRTPIWRGVWRASGYDIKARDWGSTIHANAPALAHAWRLLLKELENRRGAPTMAVLSPRPEHSVPLVLDDLAYWLTKPAVGLAALLLATEADSVTPESPLLHWPVRVGVPLGSDADAVWDDLQRNSPDWIRELSHLYHVGEAREACDILLLPSGAAERLAGSSRLRLKATFIVCLDPPGEWKEAPSSASEKLRTQIGAAGVALIGRDHIAQWYRALILELSYSQPIHAAIWAASKKNWMPQPVILGDPAALDRLDLVNLADQLDRQRESAAPSRALWRLTAWVSEHIVERNYYQPPPMMTMISWSLKMTSWPSFFWSVRPFKLGAFVRAHERDHDDHSPSKVASKISRASPKIDSKPRPRWIKAAFERVESSDDRYANGLDPPVPPDALNVLAIHVGPQEAGRFDSIFPEKSLDFSGGCVPATVQVELVGAHVSPFWGWHDAKLSQRPNERADFPTEEEPQRESLVETASFPISIPAVGDSERARFRVNPPPGTESVQGRIAVIADNRVIQTAQIQITPETTVIGNSVTVTATGVIHATLDDLSSRRKFDAALMVADDLGGRLRLTVSHNGKAFELSLANLEPAISTIKNAVSAAALGRDGHLEPSSEKMLEVLRTLASQGKEVYRFLRKGIGVNLDGLDRFQIVSYGNTFFPFEWLFDGPAPDSDASLCDRAMLKLKTAGGDGDVGCEKTCPNQDTSRILCPLRFWGMRKLIERHTPREGGTNDRDWSSRVPSRETFGAFGAVLYAASQRAFRYQKGREGKEALVHALEQLGKGVDTASTWAHWIELVKQRRPNVLVLLPHTDQIQAGTDVLVIEHNEPLPRAQIAEKPIVQADSWRLRSGRTDPRLVILLGCEAAQITDTFYGYPEAFRDAGAAIVVAPISSIAGPDAVPIATQIAKLLKDRISSSPEGVTLGELILELKRGLFAAGHPGVLGLTAIGDADWIFARPEQHVEA
jgi:hypothetical protein